VVDRDEYFLGYRSAEQERLQRQAGELAEDSRWLFDQLGSLEGAHAVEIGCGPQGCLDALVGNGARGLEPRGRAVQQKAPTVAHAIRWGSGSTLLVSAARARVP
jgi:hypothetical protein